MTTNKQKVFIEEYLKDFNATQAALRAGYSARSAYSIGQENLKKPEISEAIRSRLDELQMSADEALKRLSEIARGDMSDLMEVSSMGWSLDMKKAQERGKTGLIKKVKQTTITKIGRKQDDDDEERTFLEVELYPADAALDKILRVHGVYKDNLTINSDGELQIGVKVIDYRHSIAALAPRPVPDSSTSSENESAINGETLGQDGAGRSADDDGAE